jgi:uncharacterized protein involved in exopolysaccharide biosynthesis
MEYSPIRASLRDLLFVAFKRKWSVITILFVTLVVAVFWFWFVREDLYTTSAKVLVKLGQEQAPPATVVSGLPQVTGYRYQEVNSEVEILQNQDLLGRVVDELGLDKPGPEAPIPAERFARLRYLAKRSVRQVKSYFEDLLVRYGLRYRLAPREAVLYALSTGLDVHAQKDSNIFVAQLTMPYRESVSVVLNRLLDDYIGYRIGLYRTSGVAFFQEKAAESESELRKTGTELQKYEADGNISVLEKQQEELVHQIAASRGLMQDSELVFHNAQEKVNRLDIELASKEPNFARLGEFPKDSFPQTILGQLADLQKERERLRMTELDTGERIQNNRKQYQQLVNMLAANIRSAAADREADYRVRNSALEAQQQELARLHDRQMRWEELKRKIASRDETYTFFRRKLEEASTSAALEQQRVGNVTIIQRATVPFLPSGIRKTTLLGLSMLVAAFLSIAWMSIAEFFDHRIYARETLERYANAPVFAVIPSGRRPLAKLSKRELVARAVGDAR